MLEHWASMEMRKKEKKGKDLLGYLDNWAEREELF